MNIRCSIADGREGIAGICADRVSSPCLGNKTTVEMDLLLESFIKKDDMFRRSGQRRCSRPPHRLPDGGKRALALRASFVVGTIAMLTANVVLSATPVGTADNYRTYCASCHGSSLEGAAGPRLIGTVTVGPSASGPRARATQPEDGLIARSGNPP